MLKALRAQLDKRSHTENELSLIPILTAAKVISFSGLVGLAAFLPLYLVKTPCLAQTSPQSVYGGRLGTMTDLSIMRLLDSLDPAPSYSADFQSLSRRALSSTTRPAINGARTRLIILLVILCLVVILPALWMIFTALKALALYRSTWLSKVCRGEEMWWFRFKVVRLGTTTQGWKTLGEAKVKEIAKQNGLLDEHDRTTSALGTPQAQVDSENDRQPKIRAAFAVPRTKQLEDLISRRQNIMQKFEVAEEAYIKSFRHNFNSAAGESRQQATAVDEEGKGETATSTKKWNIWNVS